MRKEIISGGPGYGGCAGSNCPTVFRTDGGSLVVQGYKLATKDRGEFDVPSTEDVIEIPADVLLEAAAHLNAK